MVAQSEWITHPIDAFRVSSPWSEEDRVPARSDTSQAVLCATCGRRYLNQGYLDKHADEGHAPEREGDIEDALTPAPGRMPSPWQNLAMRVRDQITSGAYKPDDEVLIKTFVNDNAPWLAQRAFDLLIQYGVLRRTGTGRHTRYWVPGCGTAK